MNNQRTRREPTRDGLAIDEARTSSSGPLLTADEVAGLLGVSKEWVWDQSRRGLIPTITLGRFRRYRKEAVERWLLSIEDGTI
jgi:excisionase family DNA binding protein